MLDKSYGPVTFNWYPSSDAEAINNFYANYANFIVQCVVQCQVDLFGGHLDLIAATKDTGFGCPQVKTSRTQIGTAAT